MNLWMIVILCTSSSLKFSYYLTVLKIKLEIPSVLAIILMFPNIKRIIFKGFLYLISKSAEMSAP